MMRGVRPILIALPAALLLAWPAADAWFRLGDARAARADLLAAVAVDPVATPIVPPAAMLRARDAGAARQALRDAVAARARAGGLLLEQASSLRGSPGLAMIRFTLSGPEPALIALIDQLERQPRPVMRLAQWHFTALPGGAVRIEAVLIAPWRR